MADIPPLAKDEEDDRGQGGIFAVDTENHGLYILSHVGVPDVYAIYTTCVLYCGVHAL